VRLAKLRSTLTGDFRYNASPTVDVLRPGSRVFLRFDGASDGANPVHRANGVDGLAAALLSCPMLLGLIGVQIRASHREVCRAQFAAHFAQ